MDIICIDDKVESDVKQLFDYWITENNLYTPLNKVHLPNGEVGITLEQCPNKPLPHPNGLGTFEPSYNIKRFSTINGEQLTEKMVDTFIKSKTLVKIKLNNNE